MIPSPFPEASNLESGLNARPQTFLEFSVKFFKIGIIFKILSVSPLLIFLNTKSFCLSTTFHIVIELSHPADASNVLSELKVTLKTI